MSNERALEIIERGIEAMAAYGPDATLEDIIFINIRRGEAWAARCWVHQRKRRGPFSGRITSDRIWCELVCMAAKEAGDWKVDEEQYGLDGIKPRSKAAIKTSEALVVWFVLKFTDIAFAIDDDAWNTLDA
ncbi:hypothetical protein Q8W71_15520 [Methylobacterium sp. NEAU 140]|uniref:hypothetical protein n=1 Tax=Methylobacterium sp. NEAU 140 TaxID=3064945 RepID=UPI0027340BB0|nr:hypothetical protein [Methylobacterium sp. NEAU 140]MDP4024038.1 hypothetical protein [Methylobacterium sp. NEAU 140]